MTDILNELDRVLQLRKTEANTDTSYVASLYSKGLNKILEKVGEECTETLIAAKDAQSDDPKCRQSLVQEVADLWFHSLVLLSYFDLDSQHVIDVLTERFGLSGLEEKASRYTS